MGFVGKMLFFWVGGGLGGMRMTPGDLITLLWCFRVSSAGMHHPRHVVYDFAAAVLAVGCRVSCCFVMRLRSEILPHLPVSLDLPCISGFVWICISFGAVWTNRPF